MSYVLYEFEDLSRHVRNKVMNRMKKELKKTHPNVISKDPNYVEHNLVVLSKHLYNVNGRPICTTQTYEEGEL